MKSDTTLFACVKMELGEAFAKRARWVYKPTPDLRIIHPSGEVLTHVGAEPAKLTAAIKDAAAGWRMDVRNSTVTFETDASALGFARARQRPALFFFYDEQVLPADLASKFPLLKDPAVGAAASRFTAIAVHRSGKAMVEKLGPEGYPFIVATDADMKPLLRFPAADADPAALAKELDEVAANFEKTVAGEAKNATARDAALFGASLKGDIEADRLDPLERLVARKAVEALPGLAKGLTDKSRKLRERLIAVLEELDPRAALPYLLAWVDKEPNPRLRDLGWGAIGRAVNVTGDAAGYKALTRGILSDPYDVVVARIAGLGFVKKVEAVDGLLAIAPKFRADGAGKDPAGDAVRDSLAKLTGQSFGKDWAKWSDWWRGAREGFRFP
ncbi:MAG: HEAT repeat domain-containing protein [Planctomycetota bacterium]